MKNFLLFFSFFFIIHPNTAQNSSDSFTPFSFTFDPKTPEDSINVHAFAGVGQDSSRQLTINDLLAHQNALTFSVTSAAVDYHTYNWLRFRLVNNSSDTLRRFIWMPYVFDYIKLYKTQKDAIENATVRGRMGPLSIKYAFAHERAFPIVLPPNSQSDYYLQYYFLIKRTYSDSVCLLSPSKFDQAIQNKIDEESPYISFDHFLFGFLLVLVLMSVIFYYIFPRNNAFLYYICYLVFIGLYYLNYNILYYRPTPNLDWVNPHFYIIEIITSYGCYGFYNLFIIKFTDLGKNHPVFLKITQFFIAFWLLLIPIHCFLTFSGYVAANHYIFIISRIIILFMGFLTFGMMIKFSQNRLNIFIYLGSGFLLLFVLRGTIETITELFNFYPNNWLNNLDEVYPFIGIRLGVIIESIVFTIGLIFRGKQLAKEQIMKDSALQKQYIEQLETTQKWQEKYQTELEQEIAIKAGQLAYFEKEQAIERTRSQIAQDIHDEVGGSFTKISLAAELAVRQPNLSEAELKSRFEKMGEDAREAAGSLREIIFAINPDYDNFAEMQAYFMEYAHNFWKNTAIEPTFEFPKHDLNPLVRPDIKRQLLLIFKEAQNNIGKHAKAKNVHLVLRIVANNQYLLEIEDDGIGFSSNAQKIGPLSINGKNGMTNGFLGMENRAKTINAQLTIDGLENQGTIIRVEGFL
jgi:signal transduction histidine kinase